ncbi:MAG TPA: radical SAM protein, partial [Dehalococcoidales bacterium]|nr:radical SAM protein [Dehalococcoidales bacterium]
MLWEQVKEIRKRLAGETGTLVKDWGGKLPVALVYPNSYYIGMSNLGMQAIYRFINERTDSVCERVFHEKSDEQPLAMESQRPLTDFAVLAFSINYELDYFNVVKSLQSAGIPLFSKERTEEHPLVIAGGPCVTANPMPLAPFFDCLCIGEAEVILPQLLPLVKNYEGDRKDLLDALSKLHGIFVPSVSTQPVKRAVMKSLDEFPVHSMVMTRDTELGDMYLIEVQRGCRFQCKFCLVSCAYSPMRVHSLESIMQQAEEGLKYRKKLGLVGPAVTDHPQIDEITTQLRQMGASLSVSSLRIKPLPATLLDEVIKGGTGTVALAPEAGSQRLRDYIRKGVDEDDIYRAVEKVAAQGIKQLKLYFMVGLPTETDEDIEEMARLVTKCKTIIDKHLTAGRITLTLAPFIPKAGTAFERLGMENTAVIKKRLALLKNNLTQRGISIKHESIEWSEVQALFSRGDEKVGRALAQVHGTGLADLRSVMNKNTVDIDYYAHANWLNEQKLS